MKQNDITASLTYYYTPCVDGCDISYFTAAGKNSKQPVLKKSAATDRLTAFVQYTVEDMTRLLRAD